MGYKKHLYEKVANDLKNLRTENEAALLERKRLAFSKNPELKKINESLRLLCASATTAAMGSTAAPSSKDFLKKADSLLDLQAKALAKSGLPEDYLKLSYSCPLCKDTGIYKTSYCSCFKNRLIAELQKDSNIASLMGDESFDNFDFSFYGNEINTAENISEKENIQFIYKTCLGFVENFHKSGENLIMYGGVGLGKTYLSTCIARELIKKGVAVFYQPASKLFSCLEDVKFGKDASELSRTVADKIYDCDLLIIDDLGSEMSTSFTSAALFDIVNSRLISGKKTIINTNLDKNALVSLYSERVVSRINGEYTPLRFFGKDIRVQKRYI